MVILQRENINEETYLILDDSTLPTQQDGWKEIKKHWIYDALFSLPHYLRQLTQQFRGFPLVFHLLNLLFRQAHAGFAEQV